MRHAITACGIAAVCCLSLAACTHSEDRSAPEPSPRSTLQLGRGAETSAVDSKSTVQIHPDTVVYDGSTSFGDSQHGVFAVVAYQSTNRTAHRATTTAAQGGFRWKSPDGPAVTAGNTTAAKKLAPIGFSEGGPVLAPRTMHQDVAVFDITAAEKGGTLVYVDGDGASSQWKIPATDSGVSVPALKFALN
ncbi:hypothetical protein [Streptomyces sp. cg35]|uniref:hypothetical protein n=1 Tax=Streptomyces sp. cg35 TaxID=3421650 RepID=UPI003D181626